MKEVEGLRVHFKDDGSIEISVEYRMGGLEKLPNPGTKGRERLARKMAQSALEASLAALIDYPLEWGGFDMGPVKVKDHIVAGKGWKCG
jgi:hypothetical protein